MSTLVKGITQSGVGDKDTRLRLLPHSADDFGSIAGSASMHCAGILFWGLARSL